ncbi:MAG: hypothetical protein Q7S32_04190 [bacterium]|nr:hypothetical protein [bacterium]
MKRVFLNALDFFKAVEPEVLSCYQNKMPDVIEVGIKNDKSGKIWAEIKGFENNDILYTEANNRSDLEDKVNDAVVTYYNIPYRYARYILVNKRYDDPNLVRKKKKVLEMA